VFGTRDINPPEKRMPKLSGRIQVVYGKPLTFDRFAGMDRDRFVLRSVTDEILYEIMMLTGQEYVDEYASRVKAHRVEVGAGPGPETVEAPEAPSVSTAETRADEARVEAVGSEGTPEGRSPATG
jgi:1-acyl-sn-glycerol-3-phosphate acyltransferase